MSHTSLRYYIDRIRVGYSEGIYKGRRFGIVKSVFNDGKSSKVYAKELGWQQFYQFELLYHKKQL